MPSIYTTIITLDGKHLHIVFQTDYTEKCASFSVYTLLCKFAYTKICSSSRLQKFQQNIAKVSCLNITSDQYLLTGFLFVPEMIFAVSEKGKPIVVLDDFKYRFGKKLRGNVMRWVCTKTTCNAFLKSEDGVLVETGDNHEPLEASHLARNLLSNFLKQKRIK